MKVADFDFFLSEDLIAKSPAEKRDGSRLLVLHRDGSIEDKRFRDLPEYLNEGDMLLLNNSKVFPARLTGIKSTGGRMEILLVKPIGFGLKERENNSPSPPLNLRWGVGHSTWEILSKGKWSGRLSISEGFSAEIIDGATAHFECSGDFMDNLWEHGEMPLPPYIKRKPDTRDKEWYQTVYAEKQGSIAAPTAGLHFTGRLMDKIRNKGVHIRYLTLHVGLGTFRPIRTENVKEHSMEPEYFEINDNIIENIKKVKALNKRIISVGTTTTRTIEGYMSGRYTIHDTRYTIHDKNRASCIMNPASSVIRGYTDIFIHPGYKFKVVDSLITNFHLPHSTPLMLTSALCGLKRLKEAYNIAIARKYRFFSYGDAMLIL
ncbi:MAG: tRNA preQ1(34) S-adenosylmethionine ribosyltransferase-isomerase QueA [Nitrospirae bacterium]|nr:tRNA preQ1(34) S-adenosylmethionine ribosyltransferase-isomerase QueA [Nitrospirota bacterium]